jgi:hypothetical protein
LWNPLPLCANIKDSSFKPYPQLLRNIPVDRTSGRNIKLFICDELAPIGGLIVDDENPHITNTDFLFCLSILVVPDAPDTQADKTNGPMYRVLWHNVASSEIGILSDLDHHPGGALLMEDEGLVRPGIYVVHPLLSDGM